MPKVSPIRPEPGMEDIQFHPFRYCSEHTFEPTTVTVIVQHGALGAPVRAKRCACGTVRLPKGVLAPLGQPIVPMSNVVPIRRIA